VKRRVIIVILAILLTGLVLLGLNDTDITVADTSIPNYNEVTSNVSKASNSSVGGVITITMYAVADE